MARASKETGYEKGMREIVKTAFDKMKQDVHEATREIMDQEVEYRTLLGEDKMCDYSIRQPQINIISTPDSFTSEKEVRNEEPDTISEDIEDVTMNELQQRILEDTFIDSETDMRTDDLIERPAKLTEDCSESPLKATHALIDWLEGSLRSPDSLLSTTTMPPQQPRQQVPKHLLQQQQQQQHEQQYSRRQFSKLLLLGRFEEVDISKLPPSFRQGLNGAGRPGGSPLDTMAPPTLPQAARQYPAPLGNGIAHAPYDRRNPKLDVRIMYDPDYPEPISIPYPPQGYAAAIPYSSKPPTGATTSYAPTSLGNGCQPTNGVLADQAISIPGPSRQSYPRESETTLKRLRVKMTASSEVCMAGFAGISSKEGRKKTTPDAQMCDRSMDVQHQARKLADDGLPETGFSEARPDREMTTNGAPKSEEKKERDTTKIKEDWSKRCSPSSSTTKVTLKQTQELGLRQSRTFQRGDMTEMNMGSMPQRFEAAISHLKESALDVRCKRCEQCTCARLEKKAEPQVPEKEGAPEKHQEKLVQGATGCITASQRAESRVHGMTSATMIQFLRMVLQHCPHCTADEGAASPQPLSQEEPSALPKKMAEPATEEEGQSSKLPVRVTSTQVWEGHGMSSSTTLTQCQSINIQAMQDSRRKPFKFLQPPENYLSFEISSEEDSELPLFEESLPPPRFQRQQETGITKTPRPPVKKPRGEKDGGLSFKQKQRAVIQAVRGVAALSPGSGGSGVPRRERTRERTTLPKEQYDHVTMGEMRKNGYSDRLPPDRRPEDRVRVRPEKDTNGNGATRAALASVPRDNGLSSRDKEKSKAPKFNGKYDSSEDGDDDFWPEMENGVNRVPLSMPTGLSSTMMLQCQRFDMQHGRGVPAMYPEYSRGAPQRRERKRVQDPLPKEQYDHVTAEEMRKNGYSDRLPPDRRPEDRVRVKPEKDTNGNGATYATAASAARDNGTPRRDKHKAKPTKLQKKYDSSEDCEDVEGDLQNGDNHFPTMIPPGFSSTTFMQCQRVDMQTAAGQAPRATKGNGPVRWTKEKPKPEKFQEERDYVEDDEGVRGVIDSKKPKSSPDPANLPPGRNIPATFMQCQRIDLQEASSVQSSDYEPLEDTFESSDEGEPRRTAPGRSQPPTLATTAPTPMPTPTTQQQQVVHGSRETRHTNVLLDMQFDTWLRNTWQLESLVTPLAKEAAEASKALDHDDRDVEMALIKEQLEQLRQNERRRSEEFLRMKEMMAEMQRAGGARLQQPTSRSVGHTLQLVFRSCDDLEVASRSGRKDDDANCSALLAQAEDVLEVSAVTTVDAPSRPEELHAPEPGKRAVDGPATTTQPGPPAKSSPEAAGPAIPGDLRVLEYVGGDSLLLGWRAPPSTSDCNIAGFEIYVESDLQQRVTNSRRDKALLTDLDLSEAMKIRVYAVTPGGRKLDNPATLDYCPPPQQSSAHISVRSQERST